MQVLEDFLTGYRPHPFMHTSRDPRISLLIRLISSGANRVLKKNAYLLAINYTCSFSIFTYNSWGRICLSMAATPSEIMMIMKREG